MANTALQFYDPRNGDLAFKIEPIAKTYALNLERRFNYFTIYWIQEGAGEFYADQAQHMFHAGAMLFFVPYQRLRIVPAQPLAGVSLQFHANFLCIETHNAEVGCQGVLFNDIYGAPMVHINADRAPEFRLL